MRLKYNDHYLTLYHIMRLLTTQIKEPFERIVGKGENADNQPSFLFPQFFRPIIDRNRYLNYIYSVVCKCSEFDDVQNFFVW